jgi:hypothetical protein
MSHGRTAVTVLSAILLGEMVVGGELVEVAAFATPHASTQSISAAVDTNAARRNTHPAPRLVELIQR